MVTEKRDEPDKTCHAWSYNTGNLIKDSEIKLLVLQFEDAISNNGKND